MSLNKYMHPRNPFYNNPPNFDKLAKLYPQYAKYLNNDIISRHFSKPILKTILDLEVDLPTNHLIPRIPQRLNYILWVEDLLDNEEIKTGIDIGCGTSCIFGLLTCCLHKNSKILCTEINDENIEWAGKNIQTNKLDDRIKIFKVQPDDGLLDFLKDKINNEDMLYDFLVCNPPFYNDEQEAAGQLNSKRKRKEPKSINTAHLNESVYDKGGEVEFVKRIIEESIIIQNKIKIYTTMLGKKKSLTILKNFLLKEKKIENISETQFCQGHTMRWGLAWSFNNNKKLPQIDFMKRKKEQQETNDYKPIYFELNVSLPNDQRFIVLNKLMQSLIGELKFEIIKQEELTSNQMNFVFNVNENTWSNQRAKRRRKEITNNDDNLSQEKEKQTIIKKFTFYLKIKILNECDKISFEMNNVFDDNEAKYKHENRDCLSQIVQFIKNNFKFQV